MTSRVLPDHVEVAVIGAGPAGLSAAMHLRDAGVTSIAVLDREMEAGGVPRHCGHPVFGLREFYRLLDGPNYARTMVKAAHGIDIFTKTTVTKLHRGGRLTLSMPEGPRDLHADRIILATGARETPRSARLISGERPWGVLTTGALQQFVYLAKEVPFKRPVIVGSELVSFSTILTLRTAGVKPLAMIEENARITTYRPADVLARLAFGLDIYKNTHIIDIEKDSVDGRVKSVTLFSQDQGEWTLGCDGVIFTGHFVPEVGMISQSHIELDPGTGGPIIDQHWRTNDPHIFAAGNMLHPIETAGVAFREGAAVGASVFASLRGENPDRSKIIPLRIHDPIKFVYPQTLCLEGNKPHRLMMKARVAHKIKGLLELKINGSVAWSKRGTFLPERRISLPTHIIYPDKIKSIELGFQS